MRPPPALPSRSSVQRTSRPALPLAPSPSRASVQWPSSGTTDSPFAGKPVERTGDSPPKPGRPYLEVLDPASVPETPASPNPFAIMGAGCLAGLLLGPVYARLRRRSPRSTPVLYAYCSTLGGPLPASATARA